MPPRTPVETLFGCTHVFTDGRDSVPLTHMQDEMIFIFLKLAWMKDVARIKIRVGLLCKASVACLMGKSLARPKNTQ